MTIYCAQDESGDLGFDFSKPRTSKHFCITIVATTEIRKLDKIVSRAFSDFKHRHIKHPTGTLHAHNESKRTNQTIIRRLLETDAQIFTISIDKTTVDIEDSVAFYNNLTISLLEKVFQIAEAEKIILYASAKDTKAALIEQFKTSLSAAFGEKLDVEVLRPQASKPLQIADCVSYGAYRQYERNDSTYYDLMKDVLHEFEYEKDKTSAA